MSEVLTQSQIDQLLLSVTSGEADKKQLFEPGHKERKYDFSAPKKFTKESLKFLDSIYVNYARVVASHLSSILRLTCEVELIDIEEQNYSEFNNALNDTDVLSLIDFEVSEDSSDSPPIMMHITNSIIYVMIDRMMGGSGDPGEDDDSPFTEIELSLFNNLNRHIVPLMNDVWQNYFTAKLNYSKIEANPRLLQSTAAEDTVVIVVLNITLKEVGGTINICLPGESLELMFKSFEDRNYRAKDHRGENPSSEIILANISNSTLSVSAKLGEAELMLRDLVGLNVGDIINLYKPQDSDVVLCVEDTPWFYGELGVQKQNIAIKINGPIADK